MTKEPADWAKIKAYRATWRYTNLNDEEILARWEQNGETHELARMYDKHEQPPVDPDLLAARHWHALQQPSMWIEIKDGAYDDLISTHAFLAGIKHGRANP